jgi:hypothetical protein
MPLAVHPKPPNAPQWLRMELLEPVPRIRTAIEQARMIRLIYHGKERILEPHDHGVLNGSVQLLGYQLPGASSRRLPNWLLMKTDEVIDLEIMNQTFPGGRPTPSGNHIKWDILFIRVKPVGERAQAGSA